MTWKTNKRAFLLVTLLVLLGGLLPLGLYGWLLGRVPTVMPEKAIQALNQPGSTAVLIDVRPPEAFQARHIVNSANIPFEELDHWSNPLQSAGLHAITFFLICDNGLTSARAVARFTASDFYRQSIRGLPSSQVQVFSVRGGLQEWAKAAWRAPDIKSANFISPGRDPYLAVQTPPIWEQAAQVFAGFGIKPTYMLLNLLLALFLLPESARDLVALRRGLFAFFVGEAFCYVNFLIFRDDSYLSEFLHSYGMVVGFGFILYALLQAVDERLFHYNNLDVRCAAIGLCLSCSRYSSSIVCRVRRAYQLIIPVLALLATIPLFAIPLLDGHTGLVFGYQYYYARFGVYQLYENRLLPLLALLCFAAAYLPLWRKRNNPAIPHLTQVFLAAGLGALCFSLIRLALSRAFAANLVYFDFWEELTELVFIVAIGAGLWVFREALFPRGVLAGMKKVFQI
jgi:rhodanese-related sulfurtransferase